MLWWWRVCIYSSIHSELVDALSDRCSLYGITNKVVSKRQSKLIERDAYVVNDDSILGHMSLLDRIWSFVLNKHEHPLTQGLVVFCLCLCAAGLIINHLQRDRKSVV